ncbi:hypothetical protein EOM39_00405 [Candidatus Gracilibacteria bacterium]|nr:hypothetical protein [Candidatus Gracilibacteria bacterium]
MKKTIYSTLLLLSVMVKSVFASSYELNGDMIKSDANKSIHNTSIVLYVLLGLLIVFGLYLIFSNSNPRRGKIMVIVSLVLILLIWFISGMLITFNSASI